MTPCGCALASQAFTYLYIFLMSLFLLCIFEDDLVGFLNLFIFGCARAFSSCGKRGLLFIAVSRLLTAVASLVAEHGL